MLICKIILIFMLQNQNRSKPKPVINKPVIVKDLNDQDFYIKYKDPKMGTFPYSSWPEYSHNY